MPVHGLEEVRLGAVVLKGVRHFPAVQTDWTGFARVCVSMGVQPALSSSGGLHQIHLLQKSKTGCLITHDCDCIGGRSIDFHGQIVSLRDFIVEDKVPSGLEKINTTG